MSQYTYHQDYRSEVREDLDRPGEFKLVIIPLKRWVVRGPWGSETHRGEERAKKACLELEAFDKKYPFECPRSAKELARARRYCGQVRK